MRRRLGLRIGRDRRAAVGLLAALTMVPLIGMASLATDLMLWQAQHQRLQAAADAAAMSAGIELNAGGSVANAQTQAKAIAAGAGYAASQVTVNSPPLSGPNTGVSGAVEVIITQPVKQYLSAALGVISSNLGARAVAANVETIPVCFYALDGNNTNATLNLTGGGTWSMSCAILDASTSSQAISTTGGVKITVTSAEIAGGGSYTGGGYLNATPPGTVQYYDTSMPADPYANRTAPTVPYGQTYGPNWTGCSPSPGTYVGGMTAQNCQPLTLSAGVYEIDGGVWNISNSTVNGTGGVTVYLANGASVQASGGPTINITAPTSGNTAGIAIWFDKSLALGNQQQFTGGTTLNITGAIYAPTQDISFTGGKGSQANCLQIVAWQISATGGLTVNHNCTGTGISDVTGSGGAYSLVE